MMVEISRSVLDAIIGEAGASPDREVCGLLYGSPDRIERRVSCRNVAGNPRNTFEIDPAVLIAAHREARGGGEPIVGCYHSHPYSIATPSRHDADAAAPDGWLWLIVGKGEVAAYRAVADGVLYSRFNRLALRTDPDA